MSTRRSPLDSLVKTKADEGEEEVQGGKSLFLRGWLTEAETAEVSTVFHLCALTIQVLFPSRVSYLLFFLKGAGSL